jgi:hypothetical protein
LYVNCEKRTLRRYLYRNVNLLQPRPDFVPQKRPPTQARSLEWQNSKPMGVDDLDFIQAAIDALNKYILTLRKS